MTTMADHGDSPFSAAIDDPGPACTLQALAVRVSQLGVRVENMFKLFETKFHYFTTRLHTFEQRHAVFRAEIDRNSLPRAKRIKVDDFKISISENEMNLMHSLLTGPVKDAIHELGRSALSDQDVALRFLRIGSDKSVALATLHSKELQRKRDSINWSFLSVDSIQVLEQRFVKTIAKKVEHTKRKIRQHSSENLLAAAKYGKDGQPFVELLLQWLLKRHDVCHVETASSSMSESNISSTTATSTSDLSLEIKMISANDSAKRELMIPL